MSFSTSYNDDSSTQDGLLTYVKEHEIYSTGIPYQPLLSYQQYDAGSNHMSSLDSYASQTPLLDSPFDQSYLSSSTELSTRGIFGQRRQTLRQQDFSPASPHMYEDPSGTGMYSYSPTNSVVWNQGSMHNIDPIHSHNSFTFQYPSGTTSPSLYSPVLPASDGDGARNGRDNIMAHTLAGEDIPLGAYRHDVPWLGSPSYNAFRSASSPFSIASSSQANSPTTSENYCEEVTQSQPPCEDVQLLFVKSMSISGRQHLMSYEVGHSSSDMFWPLDANPSAREGIDNTPTGFRALPYPLSRSTERDYKRSLNMGNPHGLQTQSSSSHHLFSGSNMSRPSGSQSYLSGVLLEDCNPPRPTDTAENPTASLLTESTDMSNSQETLIKLCVLDVLVASHSYQEAAQAVESRVQQSGNILYHKVFVRARTEKLDISSPGYAASLRRRKGMKTKALFKCIFCPTSLTTKDNLKNHYRSHLKLYASICSRCGSSFTNKAGLRRHTQNAKRCNNS